MGDNLTFDKLVGAIEAIHGQCSQNASKAVNAALTIRNWIIGCYIVEFEQNGQDRAAYGQKLLSAISSQLKDYKGFNERELRRYREFYCKYPQIREALTPEFKCLLQDSVNKEDTIRVAESSESKLDGRSLVQKLSFTHISELIKIDDQQKRIFYEIQAIKGIWSVRELRRQIASLLYERTALSTDKEKLLKLTQEDIQSSTSSLQIRDPYIFEFLGLKPKETMGESDLEDALLDKLQDFLLELGHGFCFEARQKRILIGDEYFFIDLVFYNRKLKCNVLLELKTDKFSHEYLGQLNTYLNWYKKNEMEQDDNPPVGILLCTEKNNALVEYAVADSDNSLFVSKYQLELPDKKQLQQLIENELK